MRKIVTRLLAALGSVSLTSEKIVEMRQRFGPEKSFSIMAPADWIDGVEDFSINAPNDGPSLGGVAYRFPTHPPLKEFSDARFQGVMEMGMYKQVGSERPLTSKGGVVREYQGVWPGDKFVTYYVIACLNAGSTYAAAAMTTTKKDWKKNQIFYEEMLSTFEVYP